MSNSAEDGIIKESLQQHYGCAPAGRRLSKKDDGYVKPTDDLQKGQGLFADGCNSVGDCGDCLGVHPVQPQAGRDQHAGRADYPSETAFYQNLCAFLSRAKDTLSYDRAYILYRGLEGRIAYLADADYGANLQEGVDYHGVGAEYSDDRYTSQCRSILQSQFDGRRSASFVPDILDGSYITTYLPIHDTQGQVIAVLGVDARLGYSDFAQYGPINFERTATIAALLFLISLVLFVLCMDKGLTEEEKENRWRRRRGLPPKPTKKDNIVVDTLDDIDPNDYL